MEAEGSLSEGDAALWDIKYEQGLPSLTQPPRICRSRPLMSPLCSGHRFVLGDSGRLG